MGVDIYYDFQKRTQQKWENILGDKKPELWRDSLLFLILADLRCNRNKSYQGRVDPIDSDRGLPLDMLPKKIAKIDIYKKDKTKAHHIPYGEYKYSWLLSDEILEYLNKKRVVARRTILDLETYHDLKKMTTSEETHISIAPVTNVTTLECLYIVESQENINERLRYFKEIITRLVKEYGEVRFVFGFSN